MDLFYLLLAVVLAHALHSLMEPLGMISKLKRLSDAYRGKELKPYGVNIDTRPKAFAIGYGVFIATTVLFYFLVGLFSPSNSTVAALSVVVLLAIELINTAVIDSYHVKIEKLIKKFSKGK